jgi:hypothetical protein
LRLIISCYLGRAVAFVYAQVGADANAPDKLRKIVAGEECAGKEPPSLAMNVVVEVPCGDVVEMTGC